MFCPSCGTEVSNTQKFCRSCGMGLETVSAAVAEHHRTDGSASQSLEKRKKEMGRRGTIMMLYGGALIVLLLIVFLIAAGLHQSFGWDIGAFGLFAPWVVAIGMILVVSGIGVGIYPHLTKEEGKEPPRNTADLESTN